MSLGQIIALDIDNGEKIRNIVGYGRLHLGGVYLKVIEIKYRRVIPETESPLTERISIYKEDNPDSPKYPAYLIYPGNNVNFTLNIEPKYGECIIFPPILEYYADIITDTHNISESESVFKYKSYELITTKFQELRREMKRMGIINYSGRGIYETQMLGKYLATMANLPLVTRDLSSVLTLTQLKQLLISEIYNSQYKFLLLLNSENIQYIQQSYNTKGEVNNDEVFKGIGQILMQVKGETDIYIPRVIVIMFAAQKLTDIHTSVQVFADIHIHAPSLLCEEKFTLAKLIIYKFVSQCHFEGTNVDIIIQQFYEFLTTNKYFIEYIYIYIYI